LAPPVILDQTFAYISDGDLRRNDMGISSAELSTESSEQLSNRPPVRRLRGYAFDPSLSKQLETAAINRAVLEVPWEANLQPGPIGEYVEVVDYDPASGMWYEPVDLNSINILAQDGLAPSEGNPLFHQQMVYAVAMNTITNFERALGRQVLWSPRYDEAAPPGRRETFVPRLRIYPHAMRAANAYYSPEKKALLFGYFQGPTGTVFSCLSQDIISHETTHALLDGMHRRYIEDNNEDTLAFHEAFADLIALFQHFTFPEVLKNQIARTRGDLESQSLLGELAQEFGRATGKYGALRNAIGDYDENGTWVPVKPDPRKYEAAVEPHERGSILVATMFAAFLAIYKTRTKWIFALASGGTGTLAPGDLHPEVVSALASEASKIARHFLGMCIRALDYCPPFDINFGDYLRALVTADYDMVPDDKHGYRVALIESFKRWGIIPEGLKTLSEENLRWPFARLEYDDVDGKPWNALADMATALRDLIGRALYEQDRAEVFKMLRNARETAHEYLERYRHGSRNQRENIARITGLNFHADSGIKGFKLRYKASGAAVFEVHSVVPALRVTPDGQIMKQLIVSLTQRIRNIPVDPEVPGGETFDFRGGCTVIFDMEGAAPVLRYAITRPITDTARLDRIREYRQRRMQRDISLREMYFGGYSDRTSVEPFNLLHSDH
jgi:hypothetical protein